VKLIVIGVLVGILVIFGLLATEIIDLRPDSTEIRIYEWLNQSQNEWIAANCNNEKCNDGKTIEEKIKEFIEINKSTYDENGFNMFGFDRQGLDKHGRTEEQIIKMGGAIGEPSYSPSPKDPFIGTTKVQDGMQFEYRGLDPIGDPLWVETERSYNQRIIFPLISNIVIILVIIGIIITVIYKVLSRSKQKEIGEKSFSKKQLDFLNNTSAEKTIKMLIQKGYGDKDRLSNILESIYANQPISIADKEYIIKLLEKTR